MSEKLKKPPEAKQLIVDLYNCHCCRFDDVNYIKEVVNKICDLLHTEIVEECYHKFTPIGISAVAVITTSHLSIHTWPEYGYGAVDIFSCQEDIPEKICRIIAELFEAEQIKTRLIKRRLCKKEELLGEQGAEI